MHIIKIENIVKVTKLRITSELKSLAFIRNILKIEQKIKLYGEFDIEPYRKFSVNFQAEYWYIKYLLLRDQFVNLTDDFDYLFAEQDLNIIWLRLTDNDTFELEFIDGQPFVSFLKEKSLMKDYFKSLILDPL